MVESDGQLFGVPMDHAIESVRVPRHSIHRIKQSMTAVLRGRVFPLKALNRLLGIPAQHRANADDELSVLLVQAGGGERNQKRKKMASARRVRRLARFSPRAQTLPQPQAGPNEWGFR